MNKDRQWLSGYYPPNINDYHSFDEWAAQWTEAFPEEGWVYFDGGDYNELEARKFIIGTPLSSRYYG